MYLVGNFADCEEEREISTEEAIQFAKDNGIHNYVETSAKTGQNVNEVFENITKHFFLLNEHNLDRFEEKDEEPSERGSSFIRLQQAAEPDEVK